MTAIEYHPQPGWFALDVMRVGSGRKWDWVALMIDVDPDDLKNCTCDFLQRWVRVPGKHRNQDAAWDALQNMTATRH